MDTDLRRTSGNIEETAVFMEHTVSNSEKQELLRLPSVKIPILHHDLHHDLKAYYLTASRCYRIVLNANLDEQYHPLLVAHELAHHLEHRDYVTGEGFQEYELFNTVQPLEYEANLYAAELLIDDQAVLDLLSEDGYFFTVARTLGVPPELLDFKFRLLRYKGYDLTPLFLTAGDFLKKPFRDE